MPTVHRQDGFAFRIYPNDHGPPHVHAVKAGLMARLAIGGAGEAPRVLSLHGMSDRDAAQAVRIAANVQNLLLAA